MNSKDEAELNNKLETTTIPYLREGIYRDLNIPLTLNYMTRRYVEPIKQRVDLTAATVADCAAGVGWLSFAFLLAGARRALLIDVDEPRLQAARALAYQLGVGSRCGFILSRLEDAPLGPDSVDIFPSIETLEHVGAANIRPCVEAIARCTRQAVVVTTPNFLFPLISHDTRLPVAHWLPPRLRQAYARAAGRAGEDGANSFAAPWQLLPLMRKFRPVSRYQTFGTLAEFDNFYPHYLPYGSDERMRHRRAPQRGQRMLHAALAKAFGPWSFILAPNLAAVWVRR